ncbi:LPS O-antigen chain length determinant protein WzzB [Pseudomonas flexibilis]|uniref:Chain length determinant protein (Polysaccharide antigen chain regulator) n=1 Tax=Pseudomonas flexibilis TaxID=706570 RepID=A0A1N7B6R6_9PSED|nr:Wzz/FepE/Etk N-terminal domain-containing protein [Pseudomonas flexibilis]SIR46953.1 chain length determinant protein (polysaccharide antigen chain regulator) [Pseudomonas flexibilis]
MQDHSSPVQSYRNDDEIDLAELVKGLWAEKILIAVCTVLVFGCAAIYAFLTQPTYEARAILLPPNISDISGYNLGRDEEKGLKPFSAQDVYDIFTRSLASETLRRRFFHEVYLPSVDNAEMYAQDQLWKKLNEQLAIRSPNKQRPEYWEVYLTSTAPALAAEWVNYLVAQASEMTEEAMQRNVAGEIFTKAQAVERQIEALRHTARQRREDRIAALKEALRIADSVGLENAQGTMWQTFSTTQNSSITDGSPLYLRGAKAIRAELAVLESRASDDPFIPELRSLQERLEFLKGVDVSPENVAVFTLDSPALVPETPIKPKKALILAVGLVLGGMLGIFIALVRHMLRSRQ